MSGVLFGVLFGVSVRPLNACPPVGPEALQAWSLFQGTKAWLEPRLELTGTCRKLIPALCSSRSAVLARTSILRSERFVCSRFDEKGVNKRPKLTLLGAEGGHAAQMGCRALPRRVIAPLIAPLDQLQPTDACSAAASESRRYGGWIATAPPVFSRHRRLAYSGVLRITGNRAHMAYDSSSLLF